MIKSVEKALSILTYMIDEGVSEPVSLGAIASACQIHASTCAHLVSTLCANAFLEKVSRKDGYILGPMGYRVSAKQYYRQELMESALPVMKRLSMSVCEDSTLSTFAQNKLFVPLTVDYRDEGCGYRKLQEGKLYRSASGRVFLAHMSARKVDELVAEIGYPKEKEWRCAANREAMSAALDEIRRKGVSVETNVDDHLAAAAAPVFASGGLQAVVGVYTPIARFEGEHAGECIRQTICAAKRISQRLEEKLAHGGGAVYRAAGVAEN